MTYDPFPGKSKEELEGEAARMDDLPFDLWRGRAGNSLLNADNPSCLLDNGGPFWLDAYLDGMTPEEAASYVIAGEASELILLTEDLS